MDVEGISGNRNKLKKISPDVMTKEQLVLRVRQLELHVLNLQNIIAKSGPATSSPKHHPKKKHRIFDYNKYNTRHVALKVAYLGWDYGGYVVQENTSNTIEGHLFDALQTTCLIQSRQTSNYHRCGRTDRGVSAFCQVISIDLRTNLLEGEGVVVQEGSTASQRTHPSSETEIDYCRMLNHLLPRDIRVLAWSPVPKDFSARFDCTQRTYKYYFPRVNLNIQAMEEAGKKLVGSHDFRNLCKMDIGNGVTSFIRNLWSITVRDTHDRPDTDPYSICELTIVGNAFLWHQIRCIVAVLFMVGEGKEKPEIMDDLLDIEANPCKPQYHMASELPLVLFDCQFEGTNWVIDKEAHVILLESLQARWTEQAVKAAMFRDLLREQEVNSCGTAVSASPDQHEAVYSQLEILRTDKSRSHKPLLERDRCESLEDRIQYYAKRRKTELESMTQSTSEQNKSHGNGALEHSEGGCKPNSTAGDSAGVCQANGITDMLVDQPECSETTHSEDVCTTQTASVDCAIEQNASEPQSTSDTRNCERSTDLGANSTSKNELQDEDMLEQCEKS